MVYRDEFYQKYVSTQTSQLYGDVNLEIIRKQFLVWQKYFGRFLPENKNCKIIDLGCGNGGFVYWLKEIGYKDVLGIDISPEQIEDGQKLGIKNIHYGDIKNFLDNKIAKYDVIFMRDIIEHFGKTEILNILEKVLKSLRDNGVLIVQTSNAESLISGRFRYGDFTHEISFTETSIRQVLSVLGFRETQVCSMPPVIHGLKSFIRCILWKYIEFKIKCYFLIETGSTKGIFTQNLITVAKK